LFILTMTFAFTLEPAILPAWMYHRQFPPPNHVLRPMPGIAWRDLSFPTFLFSMAAALPIALSGRIDRGLRGAAFLRSVLERGVLLFTFSLMMAYSNGETIGEYTRRSDMIGIAGFAIMFGLFVRRRPDWDARTFRRVRLSAWILTVLFLAFSPLLYGHRFSLARNDEIITELTFAAVAGSLIWYFTRTGIEARLSVLALVVAGSIALRVPGRISNFWYHSALSGFFEFDLLTVVVVGTIAGDLLIEWMRSPASDGRARGSWTTGRLVRLAALGAVLSPVLVVGLYNRWVAVTTMLVLGILAGAIMLVRRPATPDERLLRRLVLWGAFWLTLGLVLEPYQGGMKKVPGTFSFYFAMGGNALFLLTSLVIVLDVLGRRKWLRPLSDLGRNPMLGYAIFLVFLDPLLDLISPLDTVLRGSPAQTLARGVIDVVLAVVAVLYLTRKRIFWRT
jgi:predicted acyltransferase